MKRIMGIDWGTRRIGLALSDPSGFLASPLGTKEGGEPEEAVKAVIEEAGRNDAGAFVVGIPYNMNGTLGEMGELASRFADRLEEISGLPVHRWDERLTSIQADQALMRGGMSRKKRKARRDVMAARFILQSFLDARSSSSETAKLE